MPEAKSRQIGVLNVCQTSVWHVLWRGLPPLRQSRVRLPDLQHLSFARKFQLSLISETVSGGLVVPLVRCDV